LNVHWELARQQDISSSYSVCKDNSVNNLWFIYYGMVCVSLAVLGLLLTLLEFRRMSPGKNPTDRTQYSVEEVVSTTAR
jgi:hypothetical protein